MSKDKNLVPDLRFPEFANQGEWEEKVLGDLVKIRSGSSPSNYKLLKIGKYPFLKVEDLNNSKKYQSKSRDYSNDKNNVVPTKSIIFPKRGASILLNKVRINVKEVLMDSNLMAITPNEKILVDFLYYEILKEGLYKIADTSSIPQINNKHIEPYAVVIPHKKEEQQKIANCLSSLDDLIAAHAYSLETLKGHKKGLMQNLFPQTGESVPKCRFKEFENDGEWIYKKLESVAEIVTGNTPSTVERQNYNGKRLFVSPADINENRFVSQTKTTLSEIGFLKTRQIQANSVLFVCIGSTIGKVAQNKYECATNQQINALIPRKGYLSNFLYSVLDGNSKKIALISGKHAVPIINKSSFSAVELSFPPRIQEQENIASCLSTLDELITAHTDMIDQLHLHKKGLIQLLFPKVNN